MVDTDRQLPSPSATAGAIDHRHIDGPTFVVMRPDETNARATLAAPPVEIGSIGNPVAAERIVAAARIESVGVVW